MKKSRRTVFSIILLAAGIMMILAAVVYFSINAVRSSEAKKQNAHILDRINTLIPEPHPGIVEEGRDNYMPVLSIDGTDYIGIISVPAYKAEMPVASVWNGDNSRKLIARYSGTLQGSDLVLGADNSYGLFDFSKEITKNDTVFFTDMEGIVYTFTVEDVKHVKQLTDMNEADAGLMIFVRSRGSSDYIMISCR